MVDSDPIKTRELSANKFIVGTSQTPITTQTTIADASVQDLTGADTVDKTKVTADILSCKTAINLIIVRLKAFGLIA